MKQFHSIIKFSGKQNDFHDLMFRRKVQKYAFSLTKFLLNICLLFWLLNFVSFNVYPINFVKLHPMYFLYVHPSLPSSRTTHPLQLCIIFFPYNFPFLWPINACMGDLLLRNVVKLPEATFIKLANYSSPSSYQFYKAPRLCAYLPFSCRIWSGLCLHSS